MKQLTMEAILDMVDTLMEQGMTLREIKKLPVYLGNDDELNGIHTGWYVNTIGPSNSDDASFVELIEEDCCNVAIKGKSILIS